MQAAVYVRISQDRAGESLGVERQEADCRELCRARGWDVERVYVDNDMSAYSGKPRPAFRAMLADVEARKVGAVVAYHADRLYRHPRDLEALVDSVERAGATMATVAAGDFDLATASGRMVARMLGAAARGESERQSERLRRQRLQAAEDGRPHGGGARPYGHTRDMQLVPEEAAVVRSVVDNVLAGGSLYAEAARLNAAGLRTVTGGRWRPSTLRAMLTRPSLAGIRYHAPSGTTTRDAWPAIVTEDEHRLLSARLTGTGTGDKLSRRKALLSGLLRCAECGTKLSYTSAGRGRYRCDRGNGGCGSVSVLARDVELTVLRLAEQRAKRTAPTSDAKRDAVLAALRALDDRVAELEDMVTSGELSRAAYRRRKPELDAERAGLEATLRDLGETTDEQREALHDALVEWMRGEPLSADDVALLQGPIESTLGEVVVYPGDGDWDSSRAVPTR